MLFMQKQLSCVDTTTLKHGYNINVGISNKKIATYDTDKNSK